MRSLAQRESWNLWTSSTFAAHMSVFLFNIFHFVEKCPILDMFQGTRIAYGIRQHLAIRQV